LKNSSHFSFLVLVYFFNFLLISVHAQQFIFRNYSVEDGIAQSQVYSVIQDRRGILWFGTQGGGLTCYDGVRFKTFTERDGLLNNTVNQIKEDAKGNLWIATKSGLSYYDGVRFQSFQLPGKQNLQIAHFDIDARGKLWLATNEGVYLFDGKYFNNLFSELKVKEQIINTILVSDEKHIFFGGELGLFCLKNENSRLSLIDYSKQSRYMLNSIASLKKDRNGTLWIGTFGDGMYGFNGKKFFRIDLQQELYQSSVLDIYCDNQNNLWLGTLNKGVLHYHSKTGKFQQFDESDGLSSRHIRSIIQDNTGNFWFGTSGGGVCNYLGRQFTTYNRSSGLYGKLVYAILQDNSGAHWLGTDKGVTVFKSGKCSNYNASNGFKDIGVKAIVQSQTGELYFGTEGKGLFVLKDSVFKQLDILKTTHIRGLVCDQNNVLWVATAGLGLYRLEFANEGIQVKNYTVKNGLLSNRLTSLIQDRKGDLWYGTEKFGVACLNLDGKTKFRFTLKNGLKSNEIVTVAEDPKGNIWLGTLGAGIHSIERNRNNKLNHYGYEEGLTSTIAYLLTFDKAGNVLVGSEKGLDFLFLRNGISISKVKHFSKGDGFSGVETCRNAVLKDKEGTLWFGTINGVIRFFPSSQLKNTQAPILRLTDIRLFYESLSKTPYRDCLGPWQQVKKLELPSNQNHITFEFFGVNLSNPDAVRYRWKLEGFDEQWSPPSTEKSILYSNLNPGNYRFLVKACNEDQQWSKQPYVVEFSIATPFWHQWWFILLSVGTGVYVLYFIVRKRVQRIEKTAKEAQNKLQLEKELVELEQKALRLQMNPHFIFNAMNSIQSQIGIGKDKEARYYLAKFSRLMRQILDHSRSTTIALQAEIATLENYLLIEQFCNGDRFDYEILVPENLEIDFIQIPPMILQPFVENSIKHGFRQLEDTGRRGKIEIQFQEFKGYLECVVIDNGIGRKQAKALNQNSNDSSHNSAALTITKERLELLGEIPFKIPIEIIDLEKDGEAEGTKVIVRIALV
jgi:ligand-binding sensor domain-containing protein/two-component sensor histidine kinase